MLCQYSVRHSKAGSTGHVSMGYSIATGYRIARVRAYATSVPDMAYRWHRRLPVLSKRVLRSPSLVEQYLHTLGQYRTSPSACLGRYLCRMQEDRFLRTL
eukprot:88712-Rhodomonas_salina.3